MKEKKETECKGFDRYLEGEKKKGKMDLLIGMTLPIL